MDLKFLDFEQPIAELEARIDALKFVSEDSELNIGEEIERLKNKSETLTRSIFSNLSAWQIAQLARHPQRPYTLDYLERCFTDFHELEIMSALQAKVFRGEATVAQVTATLHQIAADRHSGLLTATPVNWPAAFATPPGCSAWSPAAIRSTPLPPKPPIRTISHTSPVM